MTQAAQGTFDLLKPRKDDQASPRRTAAFEDGDLVGLAVLDDGTPEMTHYREETVIPVAGIAGSRIMEEAIAHINASRFVKAASVPAQCGRNARTYWRKVQAGNIGVAPATGYFLVAG